MKKKQKRRFSILCLFLVLASPIFGQTLSEIQMRNARATGYAIVAARNPGQSFSIYVIPWDGVNTLEYNANTQINSGWHAQAAIKGNYFNQTFDGADFSEYSSVVVSQQEFDTHKSTGTQWWIVCSTLSPFAASINSLASGNIGLGTTNPSHKLHVAGTANTFLNLEKPGDSHEVGVLFSKAGSTLFYLYSDDVNNALKLQAGGLGGEHDGTPRMHFPLSNKNIYMAESGGNVGIGTTNPGGYKLAVEGKIGAREVVVTTAAWADYVFDPTYNLRPLSEVETYVKENKHLPEIPSAKEVEVNGVNLGEMNMLLLKKVEELTLYVIELEKKVNRIENSKK
ncbi:hypothetical protein [Chryseolinea sp. H1M3-3]|uniref:hypothetical protein n=1 Tax=Chryseolinea sp. H1M3-3 TaxID=3034144 RepID=UPI0023EB058F|nr:hypothetical protein [Chryseolinea sp. H1M3-3]